MYKRIWPCLVLSAALLSAACSLRSARSSAGVLGDGDYDVADSSRVLMERVDHYYKNVMHDSLSALAPLAMDFFRQHRQWENYYTTWCLMVNDLVWGGNMEEGLDQARQMHQDAVARNNAFGLTEAYTAMGIAYHFQGNNKESAGCYKEALRHYPSNADQAVRQNIYSYYCQVLIDMKDYQTTADVFRQWEDFLHQQTAADDPADGHAHWFFRYHRERYKYYFALKNYRQAGAELDRMQHYLSQEEDRTLYEAQVAGFRSQLALALKDYGKAMAYNDEEIELSRRQDFNTFLNALKHRTDLLQQLGHYEEALVVYRSYSQQRDSLIDATTRNQLNELNKRFEVDELKAQQERAQLEHERSLLRLVLGFAAVVVVALVLFLFFRLSASRRLKEAHALLEKSNNELQDSYEQLKLANVRAEESSRMKTAFIQQISHEIRTPLNILCGFTQILTSPDVDLEPEEMADVSERIGENTNRITGLVNKMLELSEASSQTVIERKDEVSVAQVALQAVDDSGIVQARHITFEIKMDETAETTRLQTHLRYASRALSILLDNAQKFTKQGQVTLTVDCRQAPVRFVVEDTGIGVPAEEAERIFDAFVQLDEFYDGTGIGLTIARSIARRLGGDITLDTSYTDGARFVFLL